MPIKRAPLSSQGCSDDAIAIDDTDPAGGSGAEAFLRWGLHSVRSARAFVRVKRSTTWVHSIWGMAVDQAGTVQSHYSQLYRRLVQTVNTKYLSSRSGALCRTTSSEQNTTGFQVPLILHSSWSRTATLPALKTL